MDISNSSEEFVSKSLEEIGVIRFLCYNWPRLNHRLSLLESKDGIAPVYVNVPVPIEIVSKPRSIQLSILININVLPKRIGFFKTLWRLLSGRRR